MCPKCEYYWNLNEECADCGSTKPELTKEGFTFPFKEDP